MVWYGMVLGCSDRVILRMGYRRYGMVRDTVCPRGDVLLRDGMHPWYAHTHREYGMST